ncbi:MAG: hypothetical protein JNM55_19375 [Anaerolineales bacterium]|nr:hypothetical protein [Anaerolineales bacterium]
MSPELPQSSFSPYVVNEIGFSEDSFWETYAQIKQFLDTSLCLDGFDDYQRFIDDLRSITDIQLVPVKDLMSSGRGFNKTIALRFDIDVEPVAAVRLARYNARFGIPSSFFLLHTAYYYGVMQGQVFYRNPLLKDLVKALIVCGCEIGLHTDALSLYLDHDVDGATAIIEEINWLRSQGVHINGTVAHNSFPVYNAENFEIFGGYRLFDRSVGEIKGKSYPLGVLTETKLGLTYEANYPIPRKSTARSSNSKITKWCNSTNSNSVESEKWMRTYLLDNPCYERGFETIVWHHGGNRWTIATKVHGFFQPSWYWKVDTKKMFRVLESLPNGIRIEFLLHPIYFSRDTTRPTSAV